MILKLGIPKGSLQEPTIRAMMKAGYRITLSERSYAPHIDDPSISGLLIRAQEIPRYVEKGVLDAGITGRDWILEQGARIKEICELRYAKSGIAPVRWVVAVPYSSPVKKLRDLKGKTIATELVNYTKKYLARRRIKARVEFSWGATEAKPPDLADAIVDLTETGSSLKANNLHEIETILESTTVFIANLKSWKNAWKKRKIQNLALLLKGAIFSEEKVGLKMNVPRRVLSRVLKELPAIQSPTLADLIDKKWVSVEVIVDESLVRDIIPRIKMAGATGIVEYPLNKIIY